MQTVTRRELECSVRQKRPSHKRRYKRAEERCAVAEGQCVSSSLWIVPHGLRDLKFPDQGLSLGHDRESAES